MNMARALEELEKVIEELNDTVATGTHLRFLGSMTEQLETLRRDPGDATASDLLGMATRARLFLRDGPTPEVDTSWAYEV